MKSIHYIINMAFAALSFTACQEEELFADYGEGTGTLTLSGIEVVSEVGDIQTRASMNDADIPSADEFTIELLDANTQEFVQELELDKRYTLEAGSYIIKASCGEECVISATPYFCGERKLTIADGDAKTITISPSLCCAIIQPRIAEDLAAQYESYTLTIIGNVDGEEPESATLTSGEDFYLACGEDKTYSLTLAGKNKLGKEVSHTWTYSDLAERTRYIVNCNPDLPSFSLPEQAETNAWSKFIYVTPVTAADFSYVPEGMTADEILANMVYEVSADGQIWNPAITDEDKIVFTGLTPSTEYTIRARFGGVISENATALTTENAGQVPDSNMDTWEEVWVANAYGGQSFYNYFLGNQNNHIWETNNAEGLNGATTHATNNIGTYWRWCAGTQSTSDVSTLGQSSSLKAAEISTLGFYTDKITGWYAGTISSNEIIPDWLGYRNSNRICLGLLYVDKTSLSSRPSGISFDYKYEPVAGDLAPVELVLYDTNSNELWHESINLYIQEEYTTKNVSIEHSVLDEKDVAYVTIRFQSGTNTDYRLMHVVEGDYDFSPRVKDRVVGSVLKIDNVVLNYDYE